LVIFNYIVTGWSGPVFASIVMLIVVIGAILLITKSGKREGKKEEGDKQ